MEADMSPQLRKTIWAMNTEKAIQISEQFLSGINIMEDAVKDTPGLRPLDVTHWKQAAADMYAKAEIYREQASKMRVAALIGWLATVIAFAAGWFLGRAL